MVFLLILFHLVKKHVCLWDCVPLLSSPGAERAIAPSAVDLSRHISTLSQLTLQVHRTGCFCPPQSEAMEHNWLCYSVPAKQIWIYEALLATKALILPSDRRLGGERGHNHVAKEPHPRRLGNGDAFALFCLEPQATRFICFSKGYEQLLKGGINMGKYS